jgi:glyoxylase-like metal-dependent hydrolase (beta-lactamase superfamily II)
MRRNLSVIVLTASLSAVAFVATPWPATSQEPAKEGRGTPAGAGAQGRGQQGRGGQPPTQNADHVELHGLHVQGNVWMVVGGNGGNVTVQAGDEGVLLVDTSLPQLSDQVMAEIKKISSKPVNYIIDTHVHPDHVGGNEALSKPTTDFLAPAQVQIIAHENVLNRMSAPTGQQAAFPAAAWPTDTYFTKQKEVFFNNEAIILLHQPAAHTDGDTIVFFRRSDVVSTGDIFQTTAFPFIDTERGGSLTGIIAALNNILDITVPRDKQEGGTYVIPGHGRLCDEHDVLEYRDMLTIIRDRVQDGVSKGMTLAQIQAAKPTLEYDARWGSTGGLQTTDQFLEKIFNELKTAKK